jgi:hypothetical protein
MITSDSQIAVWAFKYKYNLLRPVTAIRNAAALGNPAIAPDPNWESLILTPAHPDYISGHAGFGGAAVKVLQVFFGTDDVKADVIYPVSFGVTRHWRSFAGITREIDNARVWGGIHTRTADTHASALGRKVAEHCLANFLRPV